MLTAEVNHRQLICGYQYNDSYNHIQYFVSELDEAYNQSDEINNVSDKTLNGSDKIYRGVVSYGFRCLKLNLFNTWYLARQ